MGAGHCKQTELPVFGAASVPWVRRRRRSPARCSSRHKFCTAQHIWPQEPGQVLEDGKKKNRGKCTHLEPPSPPNAVPKNSVFFFFCTFWVGGTKTQQRGLRAATHTGLLSRWFPKKWCRYLLPPGWGLIPHPTPMCPCCHGRGSAAGPRPEETLNPRNPWLYGHRCIPSAPWHSSRRSFALGISGKDATPSPARGAAAGLRGLRAARSPV